MIRIFVTIVWSDYLQTLSTIYGCSSMVWWWWFDTSYATFLFLKKEKKNNNEQLFFVNEREHFFQHSYQKIFRCNSYADNQQLINSCFQHIYTQFHCRYRFKHIVCITFVFSKGKITKNISQTRVLVLHILKCFN